MRLKQVGVTLPPSILARLIEAAKEQNRSISGIAGEAITNYLAGWGKEEHKKIFTTLEQDTIRKIQGR